MTQAVATPPCEVLSSETGRSTILFPEGLPGFEDVHEWELVASDQAQPFLWLRAIEPAALSLLVLPAQLAKRGYDPRIPLGMLARMGLGGGKSSVLLVIVTLRRNGASANLRAPLVLNPETMRGWQVILEDTDWPLQHPLAGDGGE